MRPSFTEVYLSLASQMARRSTCVRLQVGCVIASEDSRQVYAVGYNGNVSKGTNTCDRFGEEAVGNCGCLHAEENAVINCLTPRAAAKVVYCTHLPCVMCAKRLINLGGVVKVVYQNDYRIRDSVKLFDEAEIVTLPHPGRATTVKTTYNIVEHVTLHVQDSALGVIDSFARFYAQPHTANDFTPSLVEQAQVQRFLESQKGGAR